MEEDASFELLVFVATLGEEKEEAESEAMMDFRMAMELLRRDVAVDAVELVLELEFELFAD